MTWLITADSVPLFETRNSRVTEWTDVSEQSKLTVVSPVNVSVGVMAVPIRLSYLTTGPWSPLVESNSSGAVHEPHVAVRAVVVGMYQNHTEALPAAGTVTGKVWAMGLPFSVVSSTKFALLPKPVLNTCNAAVLDKL